MISLIKPNKDGYVLYSPDKREYKRLTSKESDIVRKALSVEADQEGNKILLQLSESNEDRGILVDDKYMFISIITPLRVFWDITEECNARCIHCFTDSGVKASNELSTDQVLHVIDELYELGIMDVAFSGGEPFIRQDMIEIIEYTVNKGFAVSITTNGIMLDKDTIERLSNMKIKGITFSLDGFYKETYENIRRGLDLDTVLENIKYTAQCVKKKFMEVSVRTTLNQINHQEVFEILKFCDAYGVSLYKVNNTNLWGRAKNESSLRLQEEHFKSILTSLYEKSLSCNCKVELPIEKHLTSETDKDKLGSCVCTIDTISFYANGEIGPCGFCERQLIFGNVLSAGMSSLFEKHLPFDFDNEVCNHCQINKYKGMKKSTSANSFVK